MPHLGKCWEWVANKDRNGYGRFGGKTKISSHRYSWELAYGNIPDGLFVLHKCDNPSCVNPEHLFLGTQQDNMIDMVEKGRWTPRNTTNTPEGIIARRGESHPNHKLTDLQVSYIRDKYAIGDITYKEIALEMCVNITTIMRIIKRQRRNY